MRTKVKVAAAETALRRLLDAFELELLEATDEEIMAAARDLGQDPRMKTSAVFAGLTYPTKWQLQDFFELDEIKRVLLEAKASTAKLPNRRRRDVTPRSVDVSPPAKDSGKH